MYLAKTTPLQRESIFEGITFYEPIDATLLDKCINSDLMVCYNDPKWFSCETTHLTNYASKIKKNMASVEYCRSGDWKIGRFNPVSSLGLHTIRKNTRHTLCNGVFRDIDIENCHPQLLTQVLKHNEYPDGYDSLADYCNNRDKWRNDIINAYNLNSHKLCKLPKTHEDYLSPKDLAKKLILRITYGGSLSKWLTDFDINEGEVPSNVNLLIKQFKKIQKWICKHNPELFEKCKSNNLDKGKDYNHEGTTVSWLLQEKECLILEEMYKYLLSKEYIKNDICVLCNDGIMIEDKYYNPSILTELNIAVLSATGFNLTFTEKPLTDGYEDIIDEHLNFDLWKHDVTDGLFAEYFKLLYYKEFIVVNEALHSFNGVYWEKDANKKCSKLADKIDKDFRAYILKRSFNVVKRIEADLTDHNALLAINDYYIEPSKSAEILKQLTTKYRFEGHTKDGVRHYLQQIGETARNFTNSIDRYLRNVSSRDRLVKDCCRVLNNNWVEFDNDENLIAFENKIYDLETSNWVKPRHNQYISLTTGWKWVNGYSNKYKLELSRLLSEIFPNKNILEVYLEILSTGLYGKTIQHFFVAKGRGGNGKSVINSLMMKCIGNYGYKLPSTAVSQTIKEGANPAIANLNNKRFVLFQEPDKSRKICCSTIKEITGDKELNCRTLYSTDTVTRLKCSLLGEFNDLPALDEAGDAMGRRLIVIPFNSMFLNHSRFDNLSYEDKSSGNFHLANPHFTTDKFQDQHKQALMSLLMDSFKTFKDRNYTLKPPKEVVKEADEYLKYSDDLFGWYNDCFIKDDDCILSFKDIWCKFNDSPYYRSMTKSEQRKYNQKHLKDNIINNTFLKNDFRRKKSRHNNITLSADSMVGWRVKKFNDDADDNQVEEEDDC